MTNWTTVHHEPDDSGVVPTAVATTLLIGAAAMGVGLLVGVVALEGVMRVAGDRAFGWTGDPSSWGTIEGWGT